MSQPNQPLDPSAVAELHQSADTNSSLSAIHHTLGLNPAESSPGDHRHDGRSSKFLNLGSVSGSRGGNAALANLLGLLNARGVIIDNTTV